MNPRYLLWQLSRSCNRRNYGYMAFIARLAKQYRASQKLNSIYDQDDFTDFIKNEVYAEL